MTATGTATQIMQHDDDARHDAEHDPDQGGDHDAEPIKLTTKTALRRLDSAGLHDLARGRLVAGQVAR